MPTTSAGPPAAGNVPRPGHRRGCGRLGHGPGGSQLIGRQALADRGGIAAGDDLSLGVGHQDRLLDAQVGPEVLQRAILQLRPLDIQPGGDAGIEHPAGLGHQHLQAGLDGALELTIEHMVGDDGGRERRAQHGDGECREELQPNAAARHQTNSAIESMESGG